MLSSHSKIWFNFDKTGSAGGRDIILMILMIENFFGHFPAQKEGQSLILTRSDFGPFQWMKFQFQRSFTSENLEGLRIDYLILVL